VDGRWLEIVDHFNCLRSYKSPHIKCTIEFKEEQVFRNRGCPFVNIWKDIINPMLPYFFLKVENTNG